MPSDYQKWIARDVKREEEVPMTKAQRRKNWWYYHKWYLLFGAVLVLCIGSILWYALGIGQTDPDYQIAYVGTSSLPDDTVSAVKSALADMGEDLNGDGKTVVELVQYVSQDVETSSAATVQLMADIINGESYFFLLEDPERFQRVTGALSRPDGSLSSEDDPIEQLCFSWSQCPVLAGLELGDYVYTLLGVEIEGSNQELLAGLYIARRGFGEGQSPQYSEEYAALWEEITAGA